MDYQIGVADYGMDVWYGGNLNLEKRLSLLKNCGINGIEWLKGADMSEAVRKYHDRLAAVHFKDVFIKDESIGLDRWSERLRFCELNGGNCGLPLEAIVKALRDAHYDKWLLIEHDTHLRPPKIDLKKSADILKGLLLK